LWRAVKSAIAGFQIYQPVREGGRSGNPNLPDLSRFRLPGEIPDPREVRTLSGQIVQRCDQYKDSHRVFSGGILKFEVLIEGDEQIEFCGRFP
jgi:hypothetical protein